MADLGSYSSWQAGMSSGEGECSLWETTGPSEGALRKAVTDATAIWFEANHLTSQESGFLIQKNGNDKWKEEKGRTFTTFLCTQFGTKFFTLCFPYLCPNDLPVGRYYSHFTGEKTKAWKD